MNRKWMRAKLVGTAVIAGLIGVMLAVVAGAQSSPRQSTTSTGTSTGTTTVPDNRVDCSASAKRRQPLGAIKVRVECLEVARARARGTLVVRSKKKVRRYSLKPTSAAFGAGEVKTLRLKLRRKARKAAKKALSKGGSAIARITLDFEDLAGNRSTQRVNVKLRAPR